MLDEGELARLLAALAQGDRDAGATLYRRVGSLIYGICKRILRDSSLAEDAAHQAFLKLWRNAHKFDPGKGKASTWIAIVTRNVARDCRPRSLQELPDDLEAPSLNYDYLDPALKRALADLPETHRNAFVLMYAYGMTQSELARCMGAPLGTVKSWVRRATTSLRESLSDEVREPWKGEERGALVHRRVH